MRKIFLTLLLFQVTVLFGQTPANDPHWQLLWEDDFNSPVLDQSKWITANYCDDGGSEVLDMNDNVSVSNGELVIKIDKVTRTCPNPPPGQPGGPPVNTWACGSCTPGDHIYTSGWVETTDAYRTQYGYMEAKIKFPYGYKLHPTFWTWIANDIVNASNAAEIDIAEMLGEYVLSQYNGGTNNCGIFTPNLKNLPPDQIFTTNIHRTYPTCPNPDYFLAGSMESYTDWHTYGIEWSPTRIIWYIDGVPVRYLGNHGIVDPVRIILGIGLDDNNDPNTLNDTPFPSYMYVDYVKVYKLNEDCNDYIDAMNYDFSTYNNVEKNFINIGDGGGNNSLSVGDNVTIRASQYIKINGSFNVPVGASFYADANGDCPTIGTACTLTFNPCTYDFTYYLMLRRKEINRKEHEEKIR